MSFFNIFKFIFRFNIVNFILNMISEIYKDSSFDRKMRNMEKYLNINIDDTIKDFWKDEKYVDHDWYLVKSKGNDCLFAILNRNYIKKIKYPQKKTRLNGFTTWYIRLSFQDGTKGNVYARRDPQGLIDIYNWFQDYESFQQ